MKANKITQNLVPKARTKKELAERKADEERLAACRKRYHTCGPEWLKQDAYRTDAGCLGMPMQKLRASSDCCVTLAAPG
eukprot:scaffold7214_cov41-Phaeocystis_antarctica.AAC.1